MPTIAEIRDQYPQYSDMSDAQFADALHEKFYSDMPKQQFNFKIGLTPDKYQAAAQEDLKNAPSSGLTRQLIHGATFGADNTIAAAAMTPLEMIRRGVGPSEGYNYAKAREDQALANANSQNGALGTGAEILGGAVSGGGLAKGGVTAARYLPEGAGLIQRSLASALDSAGLGAVAGSMEGNGLSERAWNAAKGALGGGVVGAAAPGALSLLGKAASPLVSNIIARYNPQGFAEGQVARGIQESGITPQQLSLETLQAANEGQPQFTLADAMGNAGQRMLSTVARAPGEGRTAVVNALDARQAGQGRRVSGALAEGFGTPNTAAQTETAMTGARDRAADTAYGAVRNDAGQVNVTPALNHIDNIIGTQPGQQLQAPNDSIESVLRGFRERLARVNPDDFAAVQRIRGDMADAAQSAVQSGHGNRSRLIRGSIAQLDGAMEDASNGFRQANANFRQASQDINAVQAGRDAAMRGRTEDTIPAFQALSPAGQQGFRSGYVDPLIAQTQGAAFGANKARPLINDAFQAESDAIAPGAPMMQRRLGREQTMFETRNQALGGSRTMDNMNDHEALGVDPHLIGQIVSGNWHGALRSVLSAGSNALTGNTAEVRKRVADVLLQNGANLSPTALQQMVDKTVQRLQFVQSLARGVGRGAMGGVAAAVPALSGGSSKSQ